MFLRPVNGPLKDMRPEEKLVSKRDFDRSISSRMKSAKYDSPSFLTKTKYNSIMGQVKTAKKKKPDELHPRLAQLVKKYDVVKRDGVERLVVPNPKKQLIYLTKDELFSVIQKMHVDTDHGKMTEMTRKLRATYKNVSNEAVKAYIKLCEGCKLRAAWRRRGSSKDEVKENVQTKAEAVRKEAKVEEGVPGEKPKKKKSRKPAENQMPAKRFRNTPENASTRPQTAGCRTPQRIDFIEMSEPKDYDYNYIVVVRESTTKFVHLRPLRSHDPRELADILSPIFLCFGTPSVLSTSNPDFLASTLQTLCAKQPIVPDDIVVEPSEPSTFFAYIETLMLSWVCSNCNERWVNGLRFIQYIANLTYNEEIEKTPFEAMFGRKGKLDVSTLNLPTELLQGIRPEDEEDPNPKSAKTKQEDDEEIEDVEINELLEVVMDDEE